MFKHWGFHCKLSVDKWDTFKTNQRENRKINEFSKTVQQDNGALLKNALDTYKRSYNIASEYFLEAIIK